MSAKVTVAAKHRTLDTTTTLVSAPTLDALAASARHEHQLIARAARRTLDHAIKCGDILREARSRVPVRGGWYEWLEAAGIPRQTADVYMRIAAARDFLEANGITGINEAREFLREQGLVMRVSTAEDQTVRMQLVRRGPKRYRRRRRARNVAITPAMIDAMAAWLVKEGIAETGAARAKARQALRVTVGAAGAPHKDPKGSHPPNPDQP